MTTVVDAALTSTCTYLDFLARQQRGVQLYSVSRKVEEEITERLVNGVVVHAYPYKTQRGLSLQPETRLTYIPHESPSTRLSVILIEYTRTDGSLLLGFSQPHESTSGRVEVDYKWLVARLKTWLEDAGARVQAPFPDSFQVPEDPQHQHQRGSSGAISQVFAPKAVARWISDTAHGLPDLSDEQRHAVIQALSQPCTYTWGPPGTGKTHHAMAAAAGFLMAHGKRVLVVAPTNHALDNAMRAVLRLAPPLHIDPRLIVRLGIPTLEFLREHPEICEDKAARTELADLNSQLAELRKVLEGARATDVLLRKRRRAEELTAKWLNSIARETERLQSCQETLQVLQGRMLTVQGAHETHVRAVVHLRQRLQSVGVVAALFTSQKREIADQLSVADTQLLSTSTELEVLRRGIARESTTCDEIQSLLSQLEVELHVAHAQERRLAGELAALQQAVSQAVGMDLRVSIARLEEEIASLSRAKASLEIKLSEKSVIGVTLDTFVGRSTSSGFRVDWILLDEAAYAPIVKVLPLLTLGCPLAMFGDHRQLPPVCEADDSDAIVNAYWAQSAVALEVAWEHPDDYARIAECTQPPFENVHMTPLTRSFRFGGDLATVLGEFVYHNMGLRGSPDKTTEVMKVEVAAEAGSPEERRINIGEVKAVVDIVRHLVETSDAEDTAVLTPYKAQAEEIRRQLRKERLLHRVEVLNTHRAQGREWARVIFSAVDGTLQGCRPWFTDSKNDHGIVVINTTISRVRKQLILVVERGFWSHRKDQLLGALVGLASHFKSG